MKTVNWASTKLSWTSNKYLPQHYTGIQINEQDSQNLQQMISTLFTHCSHSKPDVFLPPKIQGFRAGDADTKLITVIPKQDLLIWLFVFLNPDILFTLLHRYIHRYKMLLAGITCHGFVKYFPHFSALKRDEANAAVSVQKFHHPLSYNKIISVHTHRLMCSALQNTQFYFTFLHSFI